MADLVKGIDWPGNAASELSLSVSVLFNESFDLWLYVSVTHLWLLHNNSDAI